VISPDQVTAQVEQIGYSSMSTQKSLGLPRRLEPPHTPLPHPGRLVRLFGSIIRILISHMNGFWNNLPVSYWIATQFVRDNLPWLFAIAS
jgi:hypothetical protein